MAQLPDILPYRSFVDGGEVDLRGDGLMVGYELTGPSPETCSETQVASRSQQLADAFRHLDTGDSVHVIYHRLPASVPPLDSFSTQAAALVNQEQRVQFEQEGHWLTPTRLYLAHHYEAPTKGLLQALLVSHDGISRHRHREVLRERALLRFQAFNDAASSGIGLKRLPNEQMFRDLLLTVTHHEYPASLPTDDVSLNEIIGCERLTGGRYPYTNGWHLRPVCITAYPTFTVPQLLAILLTQPGRMLISARFICYSAYDAQQLLRKQRQHWNREIIGSLLKVLKQWFTKETKVDADAQAQIDNIDAAIAACAGGLSFGHATITCIVCDADNDRCTARAHEIVKQCHAHGMMARIEDVNAAEAIMGSWPGNVQHNIRRPIISGANFADVVLPATRWMGC